MNDIERFERLYGAAGRELRRLVLGVSPLDYSDAKAMEVRSKVGELVRALNVAVVRWAEQAIPRSYARGARTARTALEILGRKPRKPILFDARRKLIDDTATVLIKANNSIPATVDKYLALVSQAARVVVAAPLQEFSFGEAEGELGRRAAEAVAQEKSRGWLSGQVRDFLRGLIEDDEFIEIGGRMYRMKKYADLVARTTLREAQTAATRDLCGQYENDLVVISDHGCDCDVCEEYEGNVYSLSGHSMNYPMLEDAPPFHPNCKHSMLPTSEAAIRVQKEYGESALRRQIREAEEAAQWRNIR